MKITGLHETISRKKCVGRRRNKALHIHPFATVTSRASCFCRLYCTEWFSSQFSQRNRMPGVRDPVFV